MVRTKSGLHHQTAGALATSKAEQVCARDPQCGSKAPLIPPPQGTTPAPNARGHPGSRPSLVSLVGYWGLGPTPPSAPARAFSLPSKCRSLHPSGAG
eukprot:scaffold6900_cov76-Isochrysis_galbana.AAC.3